MGHGRRQAEAEQARDGSSWRSHPHLAKPWSGRNPTRVESRLRGRRRAEAERRRERRSLSKVRAGPGAYSGGARVRFSLCCRRRARGQGRCKTEAEQAASPRRARPFGTPLGPALPKERQTAWASPGRSPATQGREPTREGSCRGSAYAAEGTHCCKGVASRAKPGSGRDPTRVGSDPDSACSARGALGCMGVAGLKPSDAGECTASPHPGEAWVGPGAPLDEVRPRFILAEA